MEKAVSKLPPRTLSKLAALEGAACLVFVNNLLKTYRARDRELDKLYKLSGLKQLSGQSLHFKGIIKELQYLKGRQIALTRNKEGNLLWLADSV